MSRRLTHRRAEISPFTVRLSPAERESVKAKARAAGVREAEFARMALAGFEPPRVSEAFPFEHEPGRDD